MRSIFCKAKRTTKHGFNVVRAKNSKDRCVQSFAKRQKLKNMNLELLELKTGKKNAFNFLQSENSYKTWI